MLRPFLAAACIWSLSISTHAALVELSGVSQMEARGSHGCAVTTGGEVRCWKQFGLAVSPAAPVPGLSGGVSSVAVNGFHSCAVLSGGSVKCWGANANGQLGDGSTTASAVPVAVQGLPWPAAALSLGADYSCALSTTGAVACWGANESGQLGDGTTTQRLLPTPVSGLSSGVTAISASRTYTCAIAGGAVVKCWGGLSGTLGIGATPSPTPANVGGLPSGATAISTGGTPIGPFASGTAFACAVVAGTTKCWGNDAAYTASSSPYKAPFDVAGVASGATMITSGGGRDFLGFLGETFSYAQSCVVTAAGGVQCWGQNNCGIVGVATGSVCINLPVFETLPPTAVPGLSSGVLSVSAAAKFTCALQATGTVKCWGQHYGDQPVAQMSGTIPQVITLGEVPYIVTGNTANLSASSSSNRAVTLASQTPGNCSVSGNTITAIAVGTCTIAADLGPDSVYYENSQVSLSIPIVSLAPSLLNISTRAFAGTGEQSLIAGFVIEGQAPQTVAIVVTGPSLAAFGIAQPLANPIVTLVRSSDQATLATNDDWQAASNAAQLQAVGLSPTNPLEAAILITLPPGAYTAVVSGAGGATGVAVVGVYRVY